MQPIDFLRLVWPEAPIFSIAEGLHRNKEGRMVPHLHGFDTIDAAADYSVSIRRQVNVWFSLHTIIAYSDKARGRVKRGNGNERECRCLYSDLDVDPSDPDKYPTQQAALQGLADFIAATGLPWPMVVSSGYGLHIYWVLTSAMPSKTWLIHAQNLRKLMEYHGVKADHQCTTDIARILRVVGTFNRKNLNDIREVRLKIAQDGLIDTYAVNTQLEALVAALPAPEVRVYDQPAEDRPDSEKPSMLDVGAACGAFKQMVKTRATHGELVWFAMAQLFRFIQNGMSLLHKVSSAHPDYDPAKTDAKIAPQIAKGIGAPLCSTIASKVFPGPDSPCATCWFRGRDGGSPIRAAQAMPIQDAPAEEEQAPLPAGFSRTKQGIMHMPGGDKLPVLVSSYDMRPVDIIDEPGQDNKAVEWDITFPLTGVRRVRLPIALHAEAKMIVILAQRGIIIALKHQKLLGDFMSSYIKSLQRHQLEMAQRTSFGWTEDHKEFVLSDVVISAKGETRAILSPKLRAVASMLTKKGTLEGQIQALKFYEHPDYVRHQIMIGASLAAVIFYMTGHAGAIINASGESGVSKTTALLAAVSLWGSKDMMLNGSSQGATYKGLMGRIEDTANLPLCIDEVTNMPDEALRELALDISQGGQRRSRDVHGREKVIEDNLRSTLMISTSNNSIHDALSSGRSGSAGSMRVLQMEMPPVAVHTRAEASRFLEEIQRHRGHVGPAFVAYAVKNQEMIQRSMNELRDAIVLRTASAPRERFWIDGTAAIVTGLAIARQLGLLNYEPTYALNWILDNVLIEQREVVEETYLDPKQTLLTYIERSYGAILKVMGDKGMVYLASSPVTQPSAGVGLLGRFDINFGNLYLTTEGFRAYCKKVGLPYHRTLRALLATKYVSRSRMTLGKGLAEIPTGQVETLLVDMNHEEIAGQAPVLATETSTVVPLKRKGP